MKFLLKVLITLLVLGFLYTCEQPSDLEFIRDNKNDPKGIYFGIKISNPVHNELIDGLYTVKIDPTFVSTQHNLKSLNLYANDSLIVTSDKIPFIYEFNTINLLASYNTLKCIAYNKNGSKVVDSVKVAHTSMNLKLNKVKMESGHLVLDWMYQADNNFLHYDIYSSDNELMSNATLIATITEAATTEYSTSDTFPDLLFYQITVTTIFDYEIKSNIQSKFNLGHIAQGGIAGDAKNVVIGKNGTIFLANGYDGLRAYTYGDSGFVNTAHIIGEYTEYIVDVAIASDNTIFVAGYFSLNAYTYNGLSFTHTAHINTGRGYGHVIVSNDGTIFLENGGGQLRAYTYDGSSFTNTANIKDGGNSRGITVGLDGTIFLADYNDGLRAYTYDGTSFTNIANIKDGGNSFGIAIGLDGTIFLADYNDGLRAYTYDGTSFTNIAHIDNGGYAYGVTAGLDGTIFLANYNDGLRIYSYDDSSFTNIAHIGNSKNAIGVAVDLNDNVFLTCGRSGLFVYSNIFNN